MALRTRTEVHRKVRTRGLVLEVGPDHAIVLTSGGDFVRTVRGIDWAVGDEVAVVGPGTRSGWLGRLPMMRVVAAALIAVLLLPLGLPGLLPVGVTAAYVSVDINPSVELAVDAQARVVSAVPLNADGQTLLEAVGNLRGLVVEKAVGRLASEAAEQGFMRAGPDNAVVVTVSPVAGSSLSPAVKRRLTEVAPVVQRAVGQARPRSKREPPAEALTTTDPSEPGGSTVPQRGAQDSKKPAGKREKPSVEVAVVATTPEVREAAGQIKTSVGRLLIALEVSKKGQVLKLDELSTRPLAEVLGALGLSSKDIGDLVKAAQSEEPEDLKDLLEAFRKAVKEFGGGDKKGRESERESERETGPQPDDPKPDEPKPDETGGGGGSLVPGLPPIGDLPGIGLPGINLPDAPGLLPGSGDCRPGDERGGKGGSGRGNEDRRDGSRSRGRGDDQCDPGGRVTKGDDPSNDRSRDADSTNGD